MTIHTRRVDLHVLDAANGNIELSSDASDLIFSAAAVVENASSQGIIHDMKMNV